MVSRARVVGSDLAAMAAREPAAAPAPGRRLPRSERQEALLDRAAEIMLMSGVDAVTMESVAEGAGVSRPLVYKHFANRSELLTDLFRRETAAFDADVRDALEGVEGFEALVRALVHAVLDSLAVRGRIFTPLMQPAVLEPGYRLEHRDRQRRIVATYAKQARAEYGLTPLEAEAAVAVFITGIDALVATWVVHPGARNRKLLEDVYVTMLLAGLDALRAR